MIAAARRDAAAIRRVIEDGIREVPRRKPRFKQLEGKAYERMGDPARALEAFREAIPYGPFSNAAGMRAVIRRLEQRIAAGTAG